MGHPVSGGSIERCSCHSVVCMFVVLSYSKRNTSCRRRGHDHHSASQRRPPTDDHISFQTTFRIPSIHTHSTAVIETRAPPAWASSHHWYRHRHRASNERLAMRRVQDWLNNDHHEATVPTPGHLDRHHDILVHEHLCRRYYIHRQY